MFETKKSQLFKTATEAKVTTPKSTNAFIKAATKKTHQTTSLGNGALKYTTTGNDFVDQFGKATAYKSPRTYAEVSKDMSTLWGQSPLDTVKFMTYLRLITRKVQLSDGSSTEFSQRGQGLKNEGIFRMIWLAINQPNAFWRNIHIFIAAGSWKDIVQMLSYDLQFHGFEKRALDWDNLGQLFVAGMENPRSSELLKKYLPQIKTNSVCKTVESQADNMIAKWLCSILLGTKGQASDSSKYKQYRKLKSSGTAHEWQQLISKGKMLNIDFTKVHGRALAQMVSGKFLANNKLEDKYTKWIESQPIAKYTGYVYELLSTVKTAPRTSATLTKYQEETINKQFLGLVETGKNGMKEGDNGLLVIVDSSGSMTSQVGGTKATAYSVALSMALYFSYLLKGRFANHFGEFSNSVILKEWKGSTPVQKFRNETSSIIAGTNFQAIGKLFADMKRQGVPESEFPSGILCLSDGCFNNTGSNKTNYATLIITLHDAGFSEEYLKNFKCILWDVPNGYYDGKGHQAFEDFADTPGLFHIGGLDGASVAFITGVEGQKKTESLPQTSEELFEAAMDQELLNMINV